MNRAKQVYTILFLHFYLPLILHYMHWKLRCAKLYISDIYFIFYVVLLGGSLMVVYLLLLQFITI